MTAAEPLACAGAPRDLGLDQGAAVRDAVRAAVARLPRTTRLAAALGADPRTARSARDARCHYPHASERLAGLARGAGVARSALAVLLARELAAGGAPAAAAGEALAVAPGEGPALLARSLGLAGAAAPAGPAQARGSDPTGAASASAGALPWILRRSAPEHDWRSVELALPWLVPALAGVNERGLAVAGVVRPAATASLDACAAPALLLVQECLQRCDGVANAIEWCERRPSGGTAALLLADAAGDVALVALDGSARRVERPGDGLFVAAAPGRAVALAKACAARGPLDADRLADALAAPLAPGVPPRATLVLDPAGCSLAFRTPDAHWTRASP